MTSADKIVINVPLYHCFGMVLGNLACLNFGATMVYPNTCFDPCKALEAITQYEGTVVFGVPTMFISMLDTLKNLEHKYNTLCLRTGFISGAGCPEALMHRIVTELNLPHFTTGYGMTEASPIMFICDIFDSFESKCKSVGKVGQYVLSKIVNPETGKVVRVEEAGEICVKGYLTMMGYWGDEDKTADTIDKDGWLRTGDLGILQEDGYLKIIGRAKDLIIRGGENIYPKELEEFFMKHPLIADAQVIGV